MPKLLTQMRKENAAGAYASRQLRIVVLAGAVLLITGCATQKEQWAAHGFLTPGPTSDPELIGVYDSEGECHAAGEAWMSRQVVGNPVSAECYPVDRN